MESDELKEMVRDCPLLIRMNDGGEYFVEKPEFIHVGDYTAGLLVDIKNFKGNVVVSLINIAAVIPHATKPARTRRRKTG
ncbi:MAG TPA: hypothetical protein VHU84_00125 [Lacipirellulaceae bacterium]|nr:hypothetical protein [Lacipirellulaceae bacterium]